MVTHCRDYFFGRAEHSEVVSAFINLARESEGYTNSKIAERAPSEYQKYQRELGSAGKTLVDGIPNTIFIFYTHKINHYFT